MKKAPFIRTAFNYDTDAVSVESGLCCDDDSLAQQNFAEECDINTIVRRFGLTGQLPENLRPPQYGDFDQITDYQSALNAVRLAGERFMEMPAELRAEFQNDPQRLMDFLADDKNRDRAVTLGLVPQRVVDVSPPDTSADSTGS